MKNFPKKFLSLWIFAVICLAGSGNLYASHAIGAELTYECMGGNRYRLTYTFYRDCEGISAPGSVDVSVTSSCYLPANVVLLPAAGSPQDVSPVCSSVLSYCHIGPYKGIEEYTYVGEFTLPGTCFDWIFAYGECCRNNVISTIPPNSTYNLYVFSRLNNMYGVCNNSPDFTTKPIPILCIGQNFCFNNGTTDIDGDSITYQLITPLSASGTPVAYTNPPYSHQRPLLTNTPPTFNPATGEFCMTPSQSDVSVFAVLVSEFRDGVLIGQVERDIQIQALSCQSLYPTVSGINGAPDSYRDTVLCAGKNYQFFIATNNAESSEMTSLSWDGLLPGAVVQQTNTSPDTLVINWTPSPLLIRTQSYCLNVSITDDACPYPGVVTKTFCFTVIDSLDSDCQTADIPSVRADQAVKLHSPERNSMYKLEWPDAEVFSEFRIVDISGRVLHSGRVGGRKEYLFDLASFQSGLYVVCLDGTSRWRGRIVRH
jgi:hypothetical protein